jgi:hypothetical protein
MHLISVILEGQKQVFAPYSQRNAVAIHAERKHIEKDAFCETN